MEFDPDNPIVKLCARGMDMEEQGKPEEASILFLQAWNESTNDFEKFISAHYLARHQKSPASKLTCDETALQLALKMNDDTIKSSFPSLYLNIAKDYEDLNEFDKARKNYELALSFTDFLPDDGYGKMIKDGIISGIERVTK